MEVEVPDILVSGWTVVLPSGNAAAVECLLHCTRQASGCTEECIAEAVRNVEHVLVVLSGNYQAISLDISVVVKRHEREDLGIYQRDRGFRTRRRKFLGEPAERTVVSGRRVLHESAQVMGDDGNACTRHST